MNLQVVYCTHRSAAISLRERLAFATENDVLRAYQELRSRFPDSESVVISTCNRVELYTAQEDALRAPTHAQLAQFFADFHQIPVQEFFDDLLEQTGPDAVRHLFEVASSLDSMVLGENQIVNQVKTAYELATKSQANGPLTNALFQRALTVSGRVRTETQLSEGRVSIASVAVADFGRTIFDTFDDKLVLVIGAGEMAEETLRYLQEAGAKRVIVVNRNLDRAVKLAEAFRGTASAWSELDHWMGQADVIVSAVSTEGTLIDAQRFRKVRVGREGRSVFILDLGTPRNFAPEVGDLDEGVFLFDIDNLESACQKNRQARAKEVEKARAIIDEETSKFMQAVYHRATGPIIKRLREDWHDVRRQELDQLFRKLSHLNDADRQTIERSIERIINRLLHPPLEALREEAREGTPHGLLDAIRRLFRLE